MSPAVNEVDSQDFLVNGRLCQVYLERAYLCWDPVTTSPNLDKSKEAAVNGVKRILLKEIVSVKTEGQTPAVVCSQPPPSATSNAAVQIQPGKDSTSYHSRPSLVVPIPVPGDPSPTSPANGQLGASDPSPHPASTGCHLLVHFVRRCTGRGDAHFKWTLVMVRFSCDSEQVCRAWKKRIDRAVRIASPDRPKSLVVFINPVGGLRTGPRVYFQQVQPLFDLVGIRTTVVTTQRANHAKDYILHEDLSPFDGIVCVGGDGMLAEVIAGLLLRARRDYLQTTGAATDPGDNHGPDSVEVTPAWRVGLIPAGSTDCVAFSIFGCNDVVTSTLHIIIGDCLGLDVVTVHSLQTGEFLSYNLSLLGYGFYGDLIAESENFRWMGPKRYDWVGFKKFVGNRAYSGEVAFLPAGRSNGHTRDGLFCRANCSVCELAGRRTRQALDPQEEADTTSSSSQPQTSGAPLTPSWQVVRGNFLCVNSCLLPARCDKAELGMSPYAHLGNGCTDLILIRDCSRMEFLRHLYRLQDPKSDHFDFPYVEVYRVRAFTFTPISPRLTHSQSTKAILPTSCLGFQRSSEKTSPHSHNTDPVPLSAPPSFVHNNNTNGEMFFFPDNGHLPLRRRPQSRVIVTGTERREVDEAGTVVTELPPRHPYPRFRITEGLEATEEIEVGQEVTEATMSPVYGMHRELSMESAYETSRSDSSQATGMVKSASSPTGICQQPVRQQEDPHFVRTGNSRSTLIKFSVNGGDDSDSDDDDDTANSPGLPTNGSLPQMTHSSPVIVRQPSPTRGAITDNYTILAPLPHEHHNHHNYPQDNEQNDSGVVVGGPRKRKTRHQRTLSYDLQHLPPSPAHRHQRNTSLHLMLQYSPHHVLSGNSTPSRQPHDSLYNVASVSTNENGNQFRDTSVESSMTQPSEHQSSGFSSDHSHQMSASLEVPSNNHSRMTRRQPPNSTTNSVASLPVTSSGRKKDPDTPAVSYWNCDGECVKQPSVYVKVHCQLIRLFARGLEIPEAGRSLGLGNCNEEQDLLVTENSNAACSTNYSAARNIQGRSRAFYQEDEDEARGYNQHYKLARTQCRCCATVDS